MNCDEFSVMGKVSTLIMFIDTNYVADSTDCILKTLPNISRMIYCVKSVQHDWLLRTIGK